MIAVALGAIYAGVIYRATEFDLADHGRAVRRLAVLGFLLWGVGGAFLVAAVVNTPPYALIGVVIVASFAAWARHRST